MQEDPGLIPGLRRSAGEGTGSTYSNFLVWRIPWTKEPGVLQSMRSQSRTERLTISLFRAIRVNIFSGQMESINVPTVKGICTCPLLAHCLQDDIEKINKNFMRILNHKPSLWSSEA